MVYVTHTYLQLAFLIKHLQHHHEWTFGPLPRNPKTLISHMVLADETGWRRREFEICLFISCPCATVFGSCHIYRCLVVGLRRSLSSYDWTRLVFVARSPFLGYIDLPPRVRCLFFVFSWREAATAYGFDLVSTAWWWRERFDGDKGSWFWRWEKLWLRGGTYDNVVEHGLICERKEKNGGEFRVAINGGEKNYI